MSELIQDKIYNTNIEKIDELATPAEIREEISVKPEIHEFVHNSREAIREIIHQKNNRMIFIVGPCSIHDEKAAFEYAEKLKALKDKVSDKIELVMRVYFEKPRTSRGWKGFINDPFINDSFEMSTGLRKARTILRKINEIGVACATEMLDPLVPQYIADLISWSAIGARTTESQTHREMASGLSMPVGFKNSTNGDVTVAINAIESSMHPHSFIGVHQSNGQIGVFHTKGNPDCHVVLRGGSNGPNYSEEHVAMYETALAKKNINQTMIVDCNHANSGKDPEVQPTVIEEILKQKNQGNKSLVGVMIESHLFTGAQKITEDLNDLKYGVSITDKCLGFTETEASIMNFYNNYNI